MDKVINKIGRENENLQIEKCIVSSINFLIIPWGLNLGHVEKSSFFFEKNKIKLWHPLKGSHKSQSLLIFKTGKEALSKSVFVLMQ